MIRRVFWAVAVGIAVLLPWMAWLGYPTPDGDSLWFLPGALAEARGDGLINTIHTNAASFDVSGRGLFVFYPPGFPWFLGKLAAWTFGPTANGVYATFACFGSLGILLAAAAYDRWASRRTPERRCRAWIAATAALLSLGTWGIAFAFGRPDTMATPLVMLGALWASACGGRPLVLALGSGLLLGLTAFIHPVAALFSAALLGLRASMRLDLRRAVLATVPAFAIGFVLLVLFFALSPNGLAASVEGIRKHAAATMVSGTWDDPRKDRPVFFFLLHSYSTGYGLLVLLAVVFLGIVVVRRWREGRGTKLGMAFFSLCLAAFAFHFVVQAWDRLYNLWLFVPVLIWIILVAGSRAIRSEPIQKPAFAIVLIVFGLCGIGFLHRLLILPTALADREGSLASARAKAAELMQGREPGTVAVSKSLWMLFDEYDRPNPIRAFSLDPALRDDVHPRYVFLQQRFGKYVTAPPLPGFRLVWDDFTAAKPRLCGVPLSPWLPTYRFAFYERE